MDTANKLESTIAKTIHGGFDKLKKTVDFEFVNVSGEVRQVGEKLTDFQSAITDLKSAMTEEFTNFKSTVKEHLDTKLQLVYVKFSDSVISKSTTVEINIINQMDSWETSVNNRMDCLDENIDELNDRVDKLDDETDKVGRLKMKIDVNHAICNQ